MIPTRTKASRSAPRATRLTALAVAIAFPLTACGSSADTDTEGAGGDREPIAGVPQGASLQEYQAAFADIEPITINTQTPGPQGSPSSVLWEDYFAAVTEWSDGKIEFDIAFANAVAPPIEIVDAVEDGRLDMASALPTYDPDNFPALNAAIDLSFNASQVPPVGPMQLAGWLTEITTGSKEIAAEFEAQGLHALVPIYHAGQDTLTCTEPLTSLDDFDGKSSRVSSRVQSKQLEGLGIEAVSLDFTEVFEGMQRGVVNCAGVTPLTGALGGLFEIAPNVIVDPEVGFAVGMGSWVINKKLWDEFPLPVRQLLHDRLDVFFQRSIHGSFTSYLGMVEAVQKYDGVIQPFAADARAALMETNEKILQQARDASVPADAAGFVDSVVAASERWYQIVTEELGFDPVASEDFKAWVEANPEGYLDDYVERIYTEIMDAHRPS